MLWFYHHDQSRRVIETTYDSIALEYVLVVHEESGPTREERFRTAEGFRERLRQLERELTDRQWTLDGPPVLLPTGWRHAGPSR